MQKLKNIQQQYKFHKRVFKYNLAYHKVNNTNKYQWDNLVIFLEKLMFWEKSILMDFYSEISFITSTKVVLKVSLNFFSFLREKNLFSKTVFSKPTVRSKIFWPFLRFPTKKYGLFILKKSGVGVGADVVVDVGVGVDVVADVVADVGVGVVAEKPNRNKLLRIFSLQQNRESKVPQKKIFLKWGKDFSILLFAVSTPYSLSCLAAVMPGFTFVVHWKITIKTF